MASPGLSEIVTTTLRNRSAKLADNMLRNNAVWMRLNKRGNVKTFGGGRTITAPLEYANNTTYKRYSGYEVLNIQPSDVFTDAEYPIRQTACAVSISGLEQLQNSGIEAVIDLLEGRIKNAEKTMQNGMSYDCYGDGSLTGQINGLRALVSTTPTSGVVGGIDRATWTFWQNQEYASTTDGGAAFSSANAYAQMLALYTRLTRQSDRPDLILASDAAWRAYNESLHAIQRITDTSSDMAKAGFLSVKFMDCDVVLDGGFQGTTTDGNTFGSGGAGAVGGVPSSVNMYFLNTNYIYLRPHRDRNMVPLDPDRFSVNQDAMVKLIAWAGNMCISNSFLQGVLSTD